MAVFLKGQPYPPKGGVENDASSIWSRRRDLVISAATALQGVPLGRRHRGAYAARLVSGPVSDNSADATRLWRSRLFG